MPFLAAFASVIGESPPPPPHPEVKPVVFVHTPAESAASTVPVVVVNNPARSPPIIRKRLEIPSPARHFPTKLMTDAPLLGACVANGQPGSRGGARILHAHQDLPPIRPGQPPVDAAVGA